MRGLLKNQTLDVLYHTNDAYFEYLCVSLVSLFENNKHLEKINIYILENQISDINRNILIKLTEEYKRHIYIYDASEIDAKLSNLGIKQHGGCYVTYYKLFFPIFFKPESENLIFLDSDTVIDSGLDELANICFKNDELFAMATAINFDAFKKIAGIAKNEPYFNGGVIVINVKQYIEENATERIIEQAKKESFLLAADEPLLNILYRNRTKRLHLKYNAPTPIFHMNTDKILKYYDPYYSEIDEIEQARQNAVIYHLAGGVYGRPWESDNLNLLTPIYDKYKVLTPFKDSIKKPRKMNNIMKIQRFLFRYMPDKIYFPIFRFFAVKNIK